MRLPSLPWGGGEVLRGAATLPWGAGRTQQGQDTGRRRADRTINPGRRFARRSRERRPAGHTDRSPWSLATAAQPELLRGQI